MAGARAGVAVKIQELEPRAVFTHCYGHALNLAVNDTITKVPKMKDCLDTCYEIVKLIKFSPKREAMLSQLKEEMGSDAPGVRTLCPTRWTVRAESLMIIIMRQVMAYKCSYKLPIYMGKVYKGWKGHV